MTIRSIGESRKRSKNIDLFEWMSGIQTIADQYGNRWHIFITNIFVGQRIETLLCKNGVT